MSRRILAIFVVAAALFGLHFFDVVKAGINNPGSSSSVSFPNGGGMLIGAGSLAYYNNGPPFLNWILSGGGFNAITLNKVAGGTQSLPAAVTAGQMDQNGALIAGAGLSTLSSISFGLFTVTPNAASIPILSGAGQWWNGLAMKITWTGTSTVTMTGTLGSGGVALSCGANSCTFTFGSNPNNVGLNFAITNVNDPPKSPFVHEVRYQTQVTALSTCVINVNCNHFRPDYVNLVKPFGRWRPMDWEQINSSGYADATEMADFNYQLCLGCSYGGIGMAANASISGTVLTVSNSIASRIDVGESVNGVGVTANTTIVAGNCGSSCTGTGQDGTYQVNNSQTVASENMYFSSIAGSFTSSSSGPKGGIHPVVAIELARLTGADVHYNVPLNITDAGMTTIATYFRDHMPSGQKVIFEYCNENWNGALGICFYWLNAAAIPFGNGATDGLEYAGFRMAQLMAITKGVYGTSAYNLRTNTTSKWMGAIGGQFVTDANVPAAFVTGVVRWQSGCSCSTKVADLFGETMIAPYWSDFPTSTAIQSITAGNPTTVNSTGSNTVNGQKVRIFVSSDGTTPLNNTDFTVTAVNANSYTIPINTTGSTYGGTMWSAEAALFDMTDASAACFSSSSASFTGTIAGTSLTATGITGAIVRGQGVTGAGVPANTYINSGTAGNYTLNNSAAVGPIAMTSQPCSTKYQFFTQQYSKVLRTASNDFSYVGNGLLSQNSYNSVFAPNQLYANSIGLELSEYEGGNQVVPQGQLSNGGPGYEYLLNYQWDAGGNDPLYTPAQLYANQFQILRNFHSQFSAKYVENDSAGVFSSVRYLGDVNPSFSAILAENALGPYIDPPNPQSWVATMPAAASNKFFGTPGCDPCTDTLASAVIGTAATSVKVLVSLTAGHVNSVTCDGVTTTTSDITQTAGGRFAAIYTVNVGAGTNTRSCSVVVAGGNSQFHEFYVTTVSGLNSTTPVTTAGGANNTPVSYTKGNLVLNVGACGTGNYNLTTGVAPSGSTPTTTTVFSFIDSVNGTFTSGAFSWPYSSGQFNIGIGCAGDSAIATYH